MLLVAPLPPSGINCMVFLLKLQIFLFLLIYDENSCFPLPDVLVSGFNGNANSNYFCAVFQILILRKSFQMWRSRIFWRLFLAYACLNTLAIISFAWVIAAEQQKHVLTRVQSRLNDTSVILASRVENMLNDKDQQELQKLIVRLGEESQIRMTIVRADGKVLADSKKKTVDEVDKMDNHKERPELVEALKTGTGHRERLSPTLLERMNYFARVIKMDGEKIGMVRTAISNKAVLGEMGRVKWLIWEFAASIILVTLGITYFVVQRVLLPIKLLTDAAESVADGDYSKKVTVFQKGELGKLADSFNHMRQEITLRLSELRDSNERFQAVLGGMNEGVVAVNRNGKVLFVNEAAGRLMNVSVEQIELQPFEQTEQFIPLLDAVNEILHPKEIEPQMVSLILNTPEGKILDINAAPLPGSPCPGAVLVILDGTEIRRSESLRQEFIANVSHELKTPLSAIKGYAETLARGAINDPENNLKFVCRIEEQAERLHALILDMLRIARIESGKQAFDLEPVLLEKLVKLCLEERVETANAKSIDLKCETLNSDATVHADEEGLQHILENLIDNALKYTPEGGQIVVRWRIGPTHVRIEVEDTGLGIPEDAKPRIFERFFRVDKARSRELGGTGLGLSIVKHLAQSFGGSVGVQSTFGEGSTFYVELPVWKDIPSATLN